MDGWNQWFVLLLPLCAASKETVVKTVGREADMTPVCVSENQGGILFVTCRITTERHRGEHCHLRYLCDKEFDNECDSRFSLMNRNQTVFILLTSLTPVDSGNYTCECSYERGTHVAHLHITVKGDDPDPAAFSVVKFLAAVVIALAGVVFVMTAGMICAHFLRGNHHRKNTRSNASELTRTGSEGPQFLDQDEPYSSLQQPDVDVYQSISSNQLHIYCEDEKDFCSVEAIYESI